MPAYPFHYTKLYLLYYCHSFFFTRVTDLLVASLKPTILLLFLLITTITSQFIFESLMLSVFSLARFFQAGCSFLIIIGTSLSCILSIFCGENSDLPLSVSTFVQLRWLSSLLGTFSFLSLQGGAEKFPFRQRRDSKINSDV